MLFLSSCLKTCDMNNERLLTNVFLFHKAIDEMIKKRYSKEEVSVCK